MSLSTAGECTVPRPECPKCGRQMMRIGVTPGGRVRWQCRAGGGSRAYCYSTTDPKATHVKKQDGTQKRSQKTPVFTRSLGGVTTLVITAAQNATPAHKPFVKALELLCQERNGEILAVPLRYKNPTSRWTASQANEDVWAPELTPYLCNERKRLNKNLVLLGDVRVQPTASSPLTGFDAMTHSESAILAHTKVQSRTVATPQNRTPKILSTTGAATVRNYTDSRAGKQGEFHHTLGALLVELKGKKFQLRRINADKKTGSFIELDRHYGVDWMSSGVADAQPALALVHGDTHVDFADPKVVKAQDELAAFLKVKHRVFHDLLDGYAVNPHHNGNPFNAIAKAQNDRADARAEVMRALEFLEDRSTGAEIVVVPSNHDDFLSRWIISQDWRTAPGNAEFYLETALAMVCSTALDPETGTRYTAPFTYWGRKFFQVRDEPVRFLDRDESFIVADIEVGMHGDRGPNGARGSLKNLRRIGAKTIIGHSHSPGEDEGGMQVGTSTRLKLEYTSGPSGWLNTDALIYANGKRTLINYIDGEYRL